MAVRPWAPVFLLAVCWGLLWLLGPPTAPSCVGSPLHWASHKLAVTSAALAMKNLSLSFVWVDRLSPLHLTALWGFLFAAPSGTYSSAVSACLASCVCGLCSAGCRTVVPRASGVWVLGLCQGFLSLDVECLFDRLQPFVSVAVQQVVVIFGIFVRGDELKSFYSAVLCLTWGERLTNLVFV